MHIIVVFEEVKDDPKVSKCLMIQEAVCANPFSTFVFHIRGSRIVFTHISNHKRFVCVKKLDCFHIRFPYSWKLCLGGHLNLLFLL